LYGFLLGRTLKTQERFLAELDMTIRS